ncbi:cya3 [Symbiodinium microadriaticum]|nr:cya3 [Symbiodinium microadriaticum]
MRKDDFLDELHDVLAQHLGNEEFGVSELASELGMSRSNLLRKIKKQTNLSASQYIRQVRLQHAMKMLKGSSLNVSEISYKVGFNSTSYFIKCFREFYGHPPGEVGKREDEGSKEVLEAKTHSFRWLGLPIIILLLVSGWWYFNREEPVADSPPEKSIAVLPFKNESNDSSNLYFINGMMESILTNLQKIEDLRVISRTSVEKYRDLSMSIPEIAEELGVSYFVEGSGQKVGDEIQLSIQLIEASGDNHLWAEQYRREIRDVFEIQQEIAKAIAESIEVVIQPTAIEQIEKIPTENMEAWDYFLKGQDLFYQQTRETSGQAIEWFKRAIEADPQFAHAYAMTAISYYVMDVFSTEKKYSLEISDYADQALLLDPKLSVSLVAKAFFYMYEGKPTLAIPYLERALEFNPNNADILNILGDIYARYVPNTSKYLEYALKGLQVQVKSDSTEVGYIYLHLSNALIQVGFEEESLQYADLSLQYDPQNPYATMVKAFILYTLNEDLDETRGILQDMLRRDTTRVDVLQEIAKLYFFERNYEEAFRYFKQFNDICEVNDLDIYPHEQGKIAVTYERMGYDEEATIYFEKFKEFALNDVSIYAPLNRAEYYILIGEQERAISEFKKFEEIRDFQYWILMFIEMDPILDPIINLPEIQHMMNFASG